MKESSPICSLGGEGHQLFMGWGRQAAAACSEVQRHLGNPGFQGPASQSPWPLCQGCRFSEEDLKCQWVGPALVEHSVYFRFSHSC